MTINVRMISPQNFSIPAGYNEIITFEVNPVVTPSLVDAIVWWRVYEQAYGIRVAGEAAIIDKASDMSPPTILLLDSPLSFLVELYTADTIDLLRNYIHEATIFNALGEVIGGSFGIMTVTATENR